MNTSAKKSIHKSIKFEPADDDSLKAASERWPWRSEADILRVAMRIGLKSLVADPSPLGPGPVEAGEISPPKGTDKAPPSPAPRPRVNVPHPKRAKKKGKPDPFDTGSGED